MIIMYAILFIRYENFFVGEGMISSGLIAGLGLCIGLWNRDSMLVNILFVVLWGILVAVNEGLVQTDGLK